MSYTDLVVFVVISFSFIVVLVSMKYVYDQITSELTTAMDNAEVTAYVSSVTQVWTYIDYVFLYSYVSFITGSLILSFFVRSHAVFYVFFMVAAFGLTLYSWIYYNVFEEFLTTQATFQTIYDQFTWSKRLIDNMPIIVLIFSVIIAVLQYSKPQMFTAYGFK